MRSRNRKVGVPRVSLTITILSFSVRHNLWSRIILSLESHGTVGGRNMSRGFLPVSCLLIKEHNFTNEYGLVRILGSLVCVVLPHKAEAYCECVLEARVRSRPRRFGLRGAVLIGVGACSRSHVDVPRNAGLMPAKQLGQTAESRHCCQ